MSVRSPTDYRMKRLQAGDVFVDTHKIKNEHKRRLIEVERHNKFMDMLHYPKIDPVKWVISFAKNNGIDYTKHKIEKMLKEELERTHELEKPYVESKRAKKTRIFYQNALSYLRNNMLNK